MKNWLLAPRVRPYNAQELQDAQENLKAINSVLKATGKLPAVPLLHAPTESMVRGRSIARMLGFDVAFIEPHKGFDGVAYEGIAAVSPSEKYPEVGLTVRVTQKLF